MLHLLPESYIKKLKKEYGMRSFIIACDMVSFCLFVFILGIIPSLVIIMSEKNELEKQSDALVLRISDEDQAIATMFESSVKRGLDVLKNTATLSSHDIDHLLSIDRKGIVLSGLTLTRESGSEQVNLVGVAATRAELSLFIKRIEDDGVYAVEEVPAATFTKDRDVAFSIFLNSKQTP